MKVPVVGVKVENSSVMRETGEGAKRAPTFEDGELRAGGPFQYLTHRPTVKMTKKVVVVGMKNVVERPNGGPSVSRRRRAAPTPTSSSSCLQAQHLRLGVLQQVAYSAVRKNERVKAEEMVSDDELQEAVRRT